MLFPKVNKEVSFVSYLFILLWFTSICDPMVDTLISHHRGGNVLHVGRNLFLRHTADANVGNSEGNEGHLVGTDRDLVSTCKTFVRSVFVLFLALYRVYLVYGTTVFWQSCEN